MNRLAIKLIKFYKSSISPNTSPKCRYIPTCSQYGLECYQKFNFFKASFLTLKRIMKCNPLFKCGYDPVPLSKIEKQILILTKNKL
jgi:putative membrane protein insertion efficiency factor